MGRRRGQHGLHLDGHDKGHRPEILRRSGIEIPADTAFQYLEPPEDKAYMQPDEYDQLIEDPTGFLFNVWLPRVATDVVPPGQPATFRSNMSFLKGGMAMMSYFDAFGPQIALLRNESGTVSAIAGILKAPFDIIADKLRGYRGLCMDLFRQPKKVLAACEALMPHLLHVAPSAPIPTRTCPSAMDASRLRAFLVARASSSDTIGPP